MLINQIVTCNLISRQDDLPLVTLFLQGNRDVASTLIAGGLTMPSFPPSLSTLPMHPSVNSQVFPTASSPVDYIQPTTPSPPIPSIPSANEPKSNLRALISESGDDLQQVLHMNPQIEGPSNQGPGNGNI